MFQGMQVVLGKGLRGLRKKDQPEMPGCGSNVKTDHASCIVCMVGFVNRRLAWRSQHVRTQTLVFFPRVPSDSG